MGFEKFGVVSHTTESKVDRFVDYLEKGQVMAVKCKHCSTKYFPPQVDCPRCIKADMEWFSISGRGKLVTFSVVSYGPAGFEEQAPYTIAVTVFEDGIQVLATISKDIPLDDIHIGMQLKIVPVFLPDKKISYEFKTTE